MKLALKNFSKPLETSLRIRIIVISFILIGILISSFSSLNTSNWEHNDGDDKKKPKDTAKAVVAYGNDYLFETDVDFENLNIYERIDSLVNLDTLTEGIRKEIQFYKTVANKTEDEIFSMVDSLFELDSVPYALINQINLYAALMPKFVELPSVFEIIKEDGSPYPSNAYYKTWNNRVSFDYSSEIYKNDSTLVLLLANSQKGQKYHHPLCQKTLRRYYGTVTSQYGWRDGRSHNGVDLELHLYDSILNMFDGKVRMARNYSGFGKVVIVRHYNGLETLYAHMSKIKVKEGDSVVAGQCLGLGGMSGNATGTHLHLEMRFKGLPINPAHVVSFQDQELYADTLILKKMKNRYIAYPYGKEFHIVKKGDSPYKIAKRYGMNLTAFCEMNNITSKTRLLPGQKMKIMQ